MAAEDNAIRQVARGQLGIEELRPGQEEAVRSLLDGHDTLVVMPTGSGKSAIYQIAGQLIGGPTVVVSPLIALQRDQVDAIAGQGTGDAAQVNASMRAGERREALQELQEGDLEFLLLAPEQFGNEEMFDRVCRARPSLFVVDEAHCISEWGHDFRPDYLRLGSVVEALGHPRVLAMTATAAPPVRREIVERLGMRDSRVLVRGFDRPEIELAVRRFDDAAAKREALLSEVARAKTPGIVYAATRRHAEEVAEALRERGVEAACYHAGMRKAEREQVQDDFMAGRTPVIVATKAFGMGIDKPDVRFVFHHDVSDSLDSYYQEIGRAGRDRKPARALLFFHSKDLGLQRFFAASGQLHAEQVEEVARAVEGHHEPVSPRDVQRETGLSQAKVTAALNRLEDAGAVETLATGAVHSGEVPAASPETVGKALEGQAHHREFEESRIEMMRGYAETRDCRREHLLTYFGEEFHGPCGNCDNCEAGLTPPPDGEGSLPFPLNSRVAHEAWGPGMVLRYEDDKVLVLFDTVGYKTLSLAVVMEKGLLRAAG